MKKNIMLLLLYMLIPFHAVNAACLDKTAYVPLAQQSQESLLYAVQACDTQHISYVFGTLHTSDAKIMQRIAYILPYLAKARRAWFEIITAPEEQLTLQKMMLIPAGGKTLDKIMAPEQFKAMVARFTKKNPLITPGLLAHYKPWAAAIALQILEIEIEGRVMDDYLQHYATQHKVEVRALEKAEAQLKIFDDLPINEQLQMLDGAINDYEVMAEFTKEMIQHYKARRVKEVAQVAYAALHAQNDALSHKLERLLLHQRNERMVEQLLPEFAKGNVFVAVGALHLTGETGILTHCEKAGYQVTPVMP